MDLGWIYPIEFVGSSLTASGKRIMYLRFAKWMMVPLKRVQAMLAVK